jgi:hypothetical protein
MGINSREMETRTRRTSEGVDALKLGIRVFEHS